MRKQLIIITFMAIITICCLVYTIIDQQKQIEQLEQQLQEVQMKYEIIKMIHWLEMQWKQEGENGTT